MLKIAAVSAFRRHFFPVGTNPPKLLSMKGTLACTAVAMALAAGGAWADGSASRKLVWNYPCSFTYTDKKPVEQAPKPLECDFIHVRLANAADQFNALPTVAAQKTFLANEMETAHAAAVMLAAEREKLLEITDPSKIPANLKPEAHLQALMQAQQNLQMSLALCKPFLWPQRQEDSYVSPAPTTWKETWKPCMGPVWDRAKELRAATEKQQLAVVRHVGSEVKQGIKKLADNAVDADKIFDGGTRGKDDGQVVDNGAASRGSSPAAREKQNGAKDGGATKKISPPAPPVPAVQIPKTKADQLQRNYFSRGFTEGMKRLYDDAMISVWHATGQTHTVGEPEAKADLAFQQMGPSCAVASQEQALQARGIKVTMPGLAKEGIRRGIYSEIRDAKGNLSGGTATGNMDKLLDSHHVKADVDQVTPKGAPGEKVTTRDMVKALNDDLKRTGDAIVAVNVKKFWNIGQSGGHAVYVTGAEADSKGKIVGYYVNDTGTGEAERFVPRDQFMKSWKATGDSLVSIAE